jgi:Raf kinase inhibitor-like YbhB/YbcL family protein
MFLISPSFEDEKPIPKKFTCDGSNINPELEIQNVPEEARTLALIVHDPDAPKEKGFTHWVLWNINPTTALIKQESVPPGAIEGKNDSGKNGYTGPCPPSGIHHYCFWLYALDAEINLPAGSTRGEVEAAMKDHILVQTELIGTYERS